MRWAHTAEQVESALSVWEEVFCREQGVPWAEERDGRDEGALHRLALAPDARVVGTLRLQLADGLAHIGRIAVRRDWRRRGIGSHMLEAALARAERSGCHEARLASQLAATRLYRRAGFAVVSEPFPEAGIAHVWMHRALRPRGPGGVPVARDLG